jgi:hypothetical protein
MGLASNSSKQPMRGLHRDQSTMPGWKKALAFVFGFCIELNIVIGGGGDLGNYGIRITDLLSIAATVFLGVHIVVQRSRITLLLYVLVVAAIISFRLFDPLFWLEPHTEIIVGRYASYGIASLYVALLLSDIGAANLFCWGLITGLFATVPIFILQESGQSSILVDLGLRSALNPEFFLNELGNSRYVGLWGHPNEASHVASLASAAGAYFVVVHRRFLPLILVAAGLAITFYYTQSRGGLLAGGATLGVSLLFSRQRRIGISRTMVAAFAVAIVAIVLLQFSTFSSRFLDDPTIVSNYADRLDSVLGGLELILTYPFGVPIAEFQTLMNAQTGMSTPHNGFVYFAAIFGLLALAILIASLVVNFRIRGNADVLFAFLTIQVCFSFLFEELPGSCSYTFVLCIIFARAFLRTGIIGRELTLHAEIAPRYRTVG